MIRDMLLVLTGALFVFALLFIADAIATAFQKKRCRKRDNRSDEMLQRRYDEIRAEAAGDSPTWTPHGNE